MANMEERLETVVTQAETDSSKWHTIVHGDENSTVETENGDVPTVAKQLKDIREAITGGVSDVVAEAESARDEAKSVRDNALIIKNEIEQLKTDTEEATETAKSYKNMAQTTFNSISSAVNKGIADVQTETQNQIATLQTTGDTQVNRTQTAATEQIQLASNQADRAETAAVRAENATNNKIDVDLNNISKETLFAKLFTTYSDGSSWYRVWPDGWIEQGGVANAGGTVTIIFPKAFRDTNYTVVATTLGTNSQIYAQCITKTSGTEMKIYNNGGSSSQQKSWYACGY